jgi:shikimate dehydrogenase
MENRPTSEGPTARQAGPATKVGRRPGIEESVTPVKPDAEQKDASRSPEVGGPEGPEPTRYGDWERKGRCIDF